MSCRKEKDGRWGEIIGWGDSYARAGNEKGAARWAKRLAEKRSTAEANRLLFNRLSTQFNFGTKQGRKYISGVLISGMPVGPSSATNRARRRQLQAERRLTLRAAKKSLLSKKK
jgi:hypothetical protein